MYKVNFACLFFGYLNRNSHAHEHFTCTGTLPVPVHRYRGILRSLIGEKYTTKPTANDTCTNLVPRGPFCHALEKSSRSPSLTKRFAASGNEIVHSLTCGGACASHGYPDVRNDLVEFSSKGTSLKVKLILIALVLNSLLTTFVLKSPCY